MILHTFMTLLTAFTPLWLCFFGTLFITLVGTILLQFYYTLLHLLVHFYYTFTMHFWYPFTTLLLHFLGHFTTLLLHFYYTFLIHFYYTLLHFLVHFYYTFLLHFYHTLTPLYYTSWYIFTTLYYIFWDDPRRKHQGPNYTQRLWEDRSQEARAKTQDELKWRASGCWIALYIYYSTRGLCKAVHEAMYCAMLCLVMS